MNIGLFRREHLQSGDASLIGNATADQFQRTHGAIGAWQEVEHTDDGHHSDITADSIVVGDITAGDITVTGDINSGDGAVAIGDLPASAPVSGGPGIRFGPWRILSDPTGPNSSATFPALVFQFLNEIVGPYLFRFYRWSANFWVLAPAPGVQLQLGGGGTDRLTNVVSMDVNCSGIVGTRDVQATGTVSAAAMTVGGQPVIVANKVNQVVGSALQVAGPAIADLQLLDTQSGVMMRLLCYQNTFKVWYSTSELFVVDVAGNARTLAGLYERGRAYAQGQRIPWAPLILTSAGHNCGGSITAYFSLTGYQLFWSVYAVNCVFPAGSWPYVLITAPPGYPTVTPYADQTAMRLYIPAVGDEPGFSQTDANHIQVYRYKSQPWPGGVGHVIGQGTYWIG